MYCYCVFFIEFLLVFVVWTWLCLVWYDLFEFSDVNSDFLIAIGIIMGRANFFFFSYYSYIWCVVFGEVNPI